MGDAISRGVVPILLVFVIGLALGYLPLTWAVALLVGSGALILIFVRPVIGLYLLVLAIPFGSIKEMSLGILRVGGAEALAVLTVIAWVVRMVAKREVRTVHPPLVVPLLVLLAVSSFSLLDALSLQWSLKGILVWLEVLAVYLLVVNLAGVRDLRIIVILVLLAGSLQALLGFYQFFGRRGPEGFLLFDRFIRAYGTFEQPNPYGGYLGLILPLALSLVLARWQRRGVWPFIARALTGLSLVLMGVALLMSWSRGAWLGFAAGLALIVVAGFWCRVFSDLVAGGLAGLLSGGLSALWFHIPGRGWALPSLLGGLAGVGTGLGVAVALRRRWAWLLLALLLIMGAVFVVLGGGRVLPAVVGQRLSDFVPYLELADVRGMHVTDENYAVVERLAHWQAALDMLSDHPLLGVGVGNYVPVYPAYALPGWQEPLGHAHNYYLHVAAEIGLLGLSAYLLFVLASFWHVWRVLGGVSGHWRGMALGILGVLGAFAVHSFFDNLFVHGMNMHLAILLGVATVLGRKREVSLVEAS